MKKSNLFSYPFNIVLIISTLLVFIWFRSGNIMGHAESGLPFYNPQIQLHTVNSSWSDYILGLPSNISVGSAPTYWVLSQLHNIGFSSVLLQALFFWLVLIVSGVSVIKLTKLFFPEIPLNYQLISALYYWFNPLAIVSIWNRFLNNYFAYYAFIPLLLYIYIRGIQSKKYIYSIYLIVITLIFSYALTSIAFVFLSWLMLFFITLYHLYLADKINRKFIIKYFFLSLLLFILTNLWWISQVFSYLFSGSFATVISNTFTSSGNYLTLAMLSERLGRFIDLFRLKHNTFFLYPELSWPKLYSSFIINSTEYLITGLILVTVAVNRKKPIILFLSLSLFGILFLAKGINPPYGEIFKTVFNHLSYFQVFRNPFEKFLVLAPVVFSPLLVYSIHWFSQKLNKSFNRLPIIFIFIWLGFWSFPFWSGKIFTGQENSQDKEGISFQTIIPDDYSQLTSWIENHRGNYRFLVFPLGDEGINYTWTKPYSGVELTNQLLPISSVSLNTTIPYVNDITKNLEANLLSSPDFSVTMNLLNAKYVLFRPDINWHDRRLRDPDTILSILKQRSISGELKQVAKFNQLSVWENLHWVDRTIFATSSATEIHSYPQLSDYEYINSNEVLIPQSEIPLLKNTILIHPKVNYTLDYLPDVKFEIRQDIFPSIKHLPSDRIYPLIILKEKFEASSIVDPLGLIATRISTIGKRLVEAKASAERNQPDYLPQILTNYRKLLQDFVIETINNDGTFTQLRQVYNLDRLYYIYTSHLQVLSDLNIKYSNNPQIQTEISKSLDILRSSFSKLNVIPKHTYIETDQFPLFRRKSYLFNIPESGVYRLVWGKTDLEKYYQVPTSETIQIDDQLHSLTKYHSGQFITYGNTFLTAGEHELSRNTPKEVNLVHQTEPINLKVDHGTKTLSFPIENFNSQSQYILSYNYWIKKGNGFSFSILTNNSQLKGEIPIRDEINTLSPDFANFDFTPKKFSTYFSVNSRADTAQLVLELKPYNDCESVLSSQRAAYKCQDKQFRERYDKWSEIEINDISIVRVLNETPFIIQENLSNSTVPGPSIKYEKINPSLYRVQVTQATQPYLLSLSTLFDPGWTIQSSSGQSIKSTHLVSNIYANSWFIAKNGDYELLIKYLPQNLLAKSTNISIITLVFCLVIILKNNFFHK